MASDKPLIAINHLEGHALSPRLADASLHYPYLLLLVSGGTTGFPKGVMWRHEDIYRVLFGGTDFATGEPIESEHTHAERAVANTSPMVRLPIPPMIHGATQSATWMALFAGELPDWSVETRSSPLLSMQLWSVFATSSA